jgi:hypothetical protein
VRLWLKTAAPNPHALHAELQQQLPQYRYAIRSGRLHDFIVVSGDSIDAAIILSSGKQIRVFGGFANEWLHAVWILVMLYAVVASIAGVFSFATQVSDVGEFRIWNCLKTLTGPVLIVMGIGLVRRRSRPIIRNVVDYLKKAYT